MRKKIPIILFIVAGFLFNITFALETLPVSRNLIAYNSEEGKTIFNQSQNHSFWKLIPYFTTEDGLTFCAVASATMVLNALDIPAPSTPEHAPYRIFDQNNFFTESVLNIITPAKVNMRGMSLEELAKSIETFGVVVKLTYGSEIKEDEFRDDLISAIQKEGHYIVVNFHRKYLRENGEGHFSPIAAYDKKSDRFLLLDVARYKYPMVWVKTNELYQAIRLNEKGKIKKERGYLIISKTN